MFDKLNILIHNAEISIRKGVTYGYVYFSFDEAKFITGTTLLIDDGYTT